MQPWMAIDTNTPDKPELIKAAMKAGISQADAFLAVFKFWRWATAHSEDGELPVGIPAIAMAAGIPEQFVAALVDVGWLSVCGGRCSVPEWDRRFSKGAKRLMKAAERQGRFRRGGGGKRSPVTPDRYGGVTEPLRDRQPEEEEAPGKIPASQERGLDKARVPAKRSARSAALRVQRADFGFASMTDAEHAKERESRERRCRLRAERELSQRERRTGEPWTDADVDSLAAQFVEAEVVEAGRKALGRQA